MMMIKYFRNPVLYKISINAPSFLPATQVSDPSKVTLTFKRCLQTTNSRCDPVKLAYTSYEPTIPGTATTNTTPIIIQHGLLGSRKNWASLAKAIHKKTGRKVIVPDARNHGDSPHSDELNYEVLAEDIEALMMDLKIPKATLVGHSMGGRAMMALSLSKPSLVENLVVVDISPVNASPGAEAMKNFLTVMEEVRFDSIMQRATARRIVDEQLQTVVQDSMLRQFLLTNLVEDNGRFRWRVNLRAIIRNLPNIVGDFPLNGSSYPGPTLFVGGSKSDYIRPSDHGLIRKIFLDCQFQYVPGAGHWVHSEKPAEFLDVLLGYLNKK